jgi:3-isopropylmalate/(R)-2-methylmalate dehydratase small subunit
LKVKYVTQEPIFENGGLMGKVVEGKVWKFGHDLDSDRDIFLFQYGKERRTAGTPLEKLVRHIMEPVNPDFGLKVQKGDFLVAGRNFAQGKVHREGPEVLKMVGIAAVIADSVSARFFQHALYFGLPILTGNGISEKINQGDELKVDIETGEIENLSTGERFRANPAFPPGHPLFPIMEAGGQIAYVKKKVASLKRA